MVKYKIHEPRQIAERRGIKNYKNMSKKELLSPVDESKKKRIYLVAGMQNLLQNELEQISKMKTFSENEIEEIAEMRNIKDYENMSKEELKIDFLKSERNLAEFFKNNSNNDRIRGIKKRPNKLKATEGMKKIFDEFRDTEIVLQSHDELGDIKRIKKGHDKLSDIKIIHRSLYNIAKKKNLSKLEKEKIEQYLTK